LAFAAYVMLAMRMRRLPSERLAGAIRWAASYSLTLYLLHYTLIYAITRVVPDGGWVLALASIALSNVVSAVVARPTEMRHRKLASWLKRAIVRTSHIGLWFRKPTAFEQIVKLLPELTASEKRQLREMLTE